MTQLTKLVLIRASTALLCDELVLCGNKQYLRFQRDCRLDNLRSTRLCFRFIIPEQTQVHSQQDLCSLCLQLARFYVLCGEHVVHEEVLEILPVPRAQDAEVAGCDHFSDELSKLPTECENFFDLALDVP